MELIGTKRWVVGVVNYSYINKIKALGARKLDAIMTYDVAVNNDLYIDNAYLSRDNEREVILFEFKGKNYCIEVDIFNSKNEFKRVPKTFVYYPRYIGDYIAIDIATYSMMVVLIDKNANMVVIDGGFGNGVVKQLEDGRSVLCARFITDNGKMSACYLDGKAYYVEVKDGRKYKTILNGILSIGKEIEKPSFIRVKEI